MSRSIAFSAVLILLYATAAVVFGQGIAWSLVNSRIRSEFPEVTRISTSELAERLTSAEREKPVLIDVRTDAEFEVSHLPNAQRIQPGSDAKAIPLSKDQPIVTYCSVGYRSAKFARKLREAGYKHVANLEGSIFRWANENRPLLDRDGRATTKVHPYNRVWGTLLEKSHRAPPLP